MQRRSIVTFVARRESTNERERLIIRDRPKARGPHLPPPQPPRPSLLPPTISRHISLASKKLLHRIDPAEGEETAADPLGPRIIVPIDYASSLRFPLDSETTKTVASPRGPTRRNHHKQWGPDGTLWRPATAGVRDIPQIRIDTHSFVAQVGCRSRQSSRSTRCGWLFRAVTLRYLRINDEQPRRPDGNNGKIGDGGGGGGGDGGGTTAA